MSRKEFDYFDFVDFNEVSPKSTKECIEQYLGKPVAVICARFLYRGILHQVNDDIILIKDPYLVFVSGPSSGEKPEEECFIKKTIAIKRIAIELIFQPKWCFAPVGE